MFGARGKSSKQVFDYEQLCENRISLQDQNSNKDLIAQLSIDQLSESLSFDNSNLTSFDNDTNNADRKHLMNK